MSILKFYGMSHTVVLSENILDIALWVKNPKWPPFFQGQAINSYHFRYNRRRFVFWVSIMGFSGMPYIVMLSENISHIASWVKHSRWPPFVQGQAINSYYFQHNRGSFVFLVSNMGFSGMPYIMLLSEDILDIALWVKNPRWLLFVKGRSINGHHFWQNRYRTVISVSIKMFYGIPGLMVWSGSTLNIALWVKKPISFST